jgi:hypothetical protein
MQDPQPQLPFGDQNTLNEIKRLLETQNELLRALVERLSEPLASPWQGSNESIIGTEIYDSLDEDEAVEDLFDDDEFWDESFEAEDDVLPDPPVWFAQHYPWE